MVYSLPYFHGHISANCTAERLKKNGGINGSYLLKEINNKIVVSYIQSNEKIQHKIIPRRLPLNFIS